MVSHNVRKILLSFQKQQEKKQQEILTIFQSLNRVLIFCDFLFDLHFLFYTDLSLIAFLLVFQFCLNFILHRCESLTNIVILVSGSILQSKYSISDSQITTYACFLDKTMIKIQITITLLSWLRNPKNTFRPSV